MSSFVVTMGISLVFLLVLFTGLWIMSVRLRDASIIDPAWGMGFVLVAALSSLRSPEWDGRSLLVAGLTTIWGGRLSAYLLSRNLGHGEDRRYAAMRAHVGPRFWWISLFMVFWLQALLLWFISWPLQAVIAIESRVPLGWLDALGVAIWMVGFFFESVGDWQLSRFKAIPANAGRVMDRGLWRYTRHPNYFGDCCVWWGIYLIAVSGGAWWTIFSPILMTFLLLKISGVSLLETTIVDRRPDYASYQTRTSPFFPWPPSEASSSREDPL